MCVVHRRASVITVFRPPHRATSVPNAKSLLTVNFFYVSAPRRVASIVLIVRKHKILVVLGVRNGHSKDLCSKPLRKSPSHLAVRGAKCGAVLPRPGGPSAFSP